jgi:hypothetical protein
MWNIRTLRKDAAQNHDGFRSHVVFIMFMMNALVAAYFKGK